MRNATILYCDPVVVVDCLIIFFCLMFEVNIDAFPKKQVLDIVTNIPLKFISSNFAIVFITYGEF